MSIFFPGNIVFYTVKLQLGLEKALRLKAQTLKTQRSTKEIQRLLVKSNMDFDTVVNKALNAYLPKIFFCCPFTDDLCENQKNCMGCDSSKSKP